ncbi:hypothetical protein O6H91_22G057900 [Diphasiastrum complanatum]|uniref:Uncharacterized protein n=2 Tax=Diphasiastrum complanatum TaxID=34168 RepID=A0ACC2AFV0_DIPCM|nr:hypothetical protein O6H91_22G057900 [Diphasiastrum complanatum]
MVHLGCASLLCPSTCYRAPHHLCCSSSSNSSSRWLEERLRHCSFFGESVCGLQHNSSLTLRQRSCPSSGILEIFAISSNDFRPGTNIELDGAPWRVQEFLHVKPGKGAAFVRTKLRNYITGNIVERTFRAGESVNEASVEKDVKQFTYKEGDQFVFMDMMTYEEIRLTESDIGDKKKWLAEGMECNVLSWNDRVIDVDLPITVKLRVIQTDPGLKGDTASGGSKPATVETGATVNVPLFIDTDEVILIDTRTGTYISRA